MRTLIDIPEEDIEKIKKITDQEGISRAEYVRRAIKTSLQPIEKPDRDEFFGMWGKTRGKNGRLEDGVAYQQRLRAEWDREWE